MITLKMKINRRSLVPISDMANRFSRYFKELKEKSDPIFIMKNNSIEAVMLNVEDYEKLLEIQEAYEELQLADLALRRLEKPKLGQNFEDILSERGISFDPTQN